MFLFWRNIFKQFNTPQFLALFAALLGILVPHTFRQSVITEVYGLHNLIFAIGLLLIERIISSEKPKYLPFILALVLGLGLSNHSMTLVLGLIYLCALLIAKIDILKQLRFWLGSFLGLVIGLLPNFYLLIRGRSQWILNWGEITNITDLWRHMSRFQYQPSLSRDWIVAMEQFRQQIIYIFDQYSVLVLFGVFAILILLKFQKKWGQILLVSLLATGPLVAFLTNFRFVSLHELLFKDLTAIASVFYLPYYLIFGGLIAFGIYQTMNLRFSKPVFSLLPLILSTSVMAGISFYTERKDNYIAAEKFFENVQTVIGDKPTVILTNWDPFSFPIFYLQQVKAQMKNVVMVDLEMLKAPWFLNQLSHWYPEFYKSLGDLPEYLKQETKVWMDTEKDNSEAIGVMYYSLVRRIIEKGKACCQVYVLMSRDFGRLPAGSEIGSIIEPYFVGALVSNQKTTQYDPEILEKLDLTGFENSELKYDRLMLMLSKYYTDIFMDMYKAQENKPEHQALRSKLLEKALITSQLIPELHEKIKKELRP
jgi:hypothetical protein